jgi:hypothetical protein
MAKFDPKAYYKELSKLFKTSGPVQYRQIANKIAPPGTTHTPAGTAQAFLKNSYNQFASHMAQYGTYSRMARYSDYASMESMSEIAAALDIYADEATVRNEYGNLLAIESNNPKIRELLEDLFYDTLNLEFNAWHWIRNMAKYGDQFLLVDHHPDYGVINALPMPVNEIERDEGYDEKNPTAYRYRWVAQGNRPMENWEVIHFRLLGNDAFLPFGASMIEPARRTWRQLVLLEDAVMTYRIVRSPERRVFYVDVGNLAPNDVGKYMEKFKTQIKRNMIVDSTTGRADLRYNPLPVHKDTPIPLLDGRTIKIEDLARENKEGKDNWVYSIRDNDHQIVPGKVVWCGKNYTANKIVKVTLDDGGVVKTAPEHGFILRDGKTIRADELKEGMSLMPLYRRDTEKGYEDCYNPKTERYVRTHRFVAKGVYPLDFEEKDIPVVHHKHPEKPGNKKNNHPNNLQVMSRQEHLDWHTERLPFTLHKPELIEKYREQIIAYNKSDIARERRIATNIKYNKARRMGEAYNGTELHKSHNKIRSKAQTKSWQENREERVKACEWNISDEYIEIGKRIYRENPNLNKKDFINTLKNDNEARSILLRDNRGFMRDINKVSERPIVRKLKSIGISGFAEYKKIAVQEGAPEYKNHKVASVEFVNEEVDVYCMTVVGPNGEEDRHNFAVCDFNDFGKSLILLKNSAEEDFFVAVRGDTSSRIDTLPGGTYTGDVDDLNYFQNKLFASLKIPKSYLGYEGDMGSKSGLSQQDIRFAHTIQRIQQVFVAELNKLAVIHLFSSNDVDFDDITNFTVKMANPSSIAELQRLELWRTKFEVASMATEGLLDKHFTYSRLLGLTEEEIEGIEEGRKNDQLFQLNLDSMTAEPTEDEEMGAEDDLEAPEPGGAEGDEAPTQDTTGRDDAGLPPPPSEEEEPITAARDPMRQVAAPNDLLNKKKKVKKKKQFPDLYNHAFNLKKTSMDPKRNRSELNRITKNPFGEALDPEEQAFEMQRKIVNRTLRELEESEKFAQTFVNKEKKVMKD